MGIRKGPLALALLILAAFVIKVAVLAQLHDHPLLQPHGELDSTYYVDLAQKIAAGGPLAVSSCRARVFHDETLGSIRRARSG